MKRLLDALREHGVECHTIDRDCQFINVLSQYTRDGAGFEVWEVIPATWEAVRDYLGY
jgi:hypothetical protein